MTEELLFIEQWRAMARYEGDMPTLGPREFVVVSPEVSGAGGMSVPAELGEIAEMYCKVSLLVSGSEFRV